MVGRRDSRNDNSDFYVTLIVGLIILVSLIRSCDKQETYNHASDVEVNVVK